MTRQAVYDYTIVHCLQSASTSTSPGCQGQGRCTCNCNGCNGRRWVDAEQHAPYTDEPTPPQHNWSGWPGAHCLNCGIDDAHEVCAAECAQATQCVAGHEMCSEHPPWQCAKHVNPPCAPTVS